MPMSLGGRKQFSDPKCVPRDAIGDRYWLRPGQARGTTSDEAPRLSRRRIEEHGGFRFIHDSLALSIPTYLASCPEGDVAEMGNNRRAMTDLDIGHRLLA